MINATPHSSTNDYGRGVNIRDGVVTPFRSDNPADFDPKIHTTFVPPREEIGDDSGDMAREASWDRQTQYIQYADERAAHHAYAAGWDDALMWNQRIILNREEVDSLRGGTVVRDQRGFVWERFESKKSEWFSLGAADEKTNIGGVSEIKLPVIVLYAPSQKVQS